DAGWADFGRLLDYKQRWRGGTVVTADRWFPSSKRCSACGTLNPALKLTDRVFGCGCGYRADRDLNAAVNLAAWPTLQNKTHHDPRTSEQGAGLPMPADGKALTGTRGVPVQPARTTREPRLLSRPGYEPWTPEKGGVR
ncbi:zinc ribbon domain-containing protein, partial [Nocardia rhamnosiphila]